MRRQPRVRSKYGNRKTVVQGIEFDSKWESEVYRYLRFREQAGDISQLERQVSYVLLPAFKDRHGKRRQAITYIPDFAYIDKDGSKCVVDAKGIETAVFKIKHKWFLFEYPEIRFYVVKKGMEWP